MKVLYIGDMTFAKTGGKDVNETEFVRGLCDSKNIESVSLVCFDAPSDFKQRMDLSKYKRRIFSLLPLSWFLFKVAVFDKPDIVFHRQSYFSLIVAIWALLFRIPLHVKHFVPNTNFIKGRHHSLTGAKLTYVKTVNNLLCWAAKHLDCSTGKQVDNAKSLYPRFLNKFVHVENGIVVSKYGKESKSYSKQRWVDESSRDTFVLGYVGALPWERCGQYLFPIIKELVDFFSSKGQRFVFLVAGGGDDFAYRMESLNPNLRRNVHYKSVIPYGEVPSILCAMDVLVALDDFERVMYLGNAHQKIRQAIASHVPVITCNFQLSPFLDTCVFNIASPDKLADTVKDVASLNCKFENLSSMDVVKKIEQRLDLYMPTRTNANN